VGDGVTTKNTAVTSPAGLLASVWRRSTTLGTNMMLRTNTLAATLTTIRLLTRPRGSQESCSPTANQDNTRERAASVRSAIRHSPCARSARPSCHPKEANSATS